MITYSNLVDIISVVDKTTYLQLLAQRSDFKKIKLGERMIDFSERGLVVIRDGYDIVVTADMDDIVMYTKLVDPTYQVLTELFGETHSNQIALTGMNLGEYIETLTEVRDYLQTVSYDGFGLDITDCTVPYIDATINVLLEINKDNIVTALGLESSDTTNLAMIHRVAGVDSYYCRCPYPGMIEYGSLSSSIVIHQMDRIVINEIPFIHSSIVASAESKLHLPSISIKLMSLMGAIHSLRKHPQLFI